VLILRLVADDHLCAIGEIPWSLLQRIAKPVSMICGVAARHGNFLMRPVPIEQKILAVRHQLGASNRSGAT